MDAAVGLGPEPGAGHRDGLALLDLGEGGGGDHGGVEGVPGGRRAEGEAADILPGAAVWLRGVRGGVLCRGDGEVGPPPLP